jgi:Holliday junction resolvase RusA-like endonuclease
MTAKFTVPGPPKGKGRPRFGIVRGKTIARTPKDTVEYENLVRVEYTAQCGSTRFDDDAALDLRAVAYYQIPKSCGKRKRQDMESGAIRPNKKPDVDNILKAIADSLNEIAYRDDAQIVDTQVRKFYSRRPRVEVTITEAKGRSENT